MSAPVISRSLWVALCIFVCSLSVPAFAGLPTINDIKNAVHKGIVDTGNALQTGAQDAGRAIETAGHQTGKAFERAGQDTGKTLEKATHDIGHTLEKATQDTGKTAEKAAQDTGKTMEKAVHDTGDAGDALGRFINREAIDITDDARTSATKVARGKVIDGIWELGTRPLKSTEHNAGRMVQESAVISAVGQGAATVYGGPAGAAAFATWSTYKVTGDMNLSLRVGMITGATSLALQGVAKMPDGTTPEIAKKAIAAGTVSALAVAVSGGDIKDVKKGFAVGAGMILIQAAYQNYAGKPLDAKHLSATQGGDCMLSSGAPCSPPDYVLVKDSNGKVLYGDPTKFHATDPVVNYVGVQVDADTTSGFKYWISERSPVMEFIGKHLGAANAGGLAHDKVVIQFNLPPAASVATIAPVMVMTYAGAGASVYSGIQSAGVKGAKSVSTSIPASLSDSRSAVTVCTQPNNLKVTTTISVDVPNEKSGLICEVTERSEGRVTHPWNAAHDVEYCASKARDRTTFLMGTGWKCLVP